MCAALQAIKDGLCKPGIVLKPADPDKPYILHTDWSKQGLSAVLGQLDADGNEYLVACLSRSCNVHETNYGSYKGEMLAATWAIRSLRHYLLGAKHPFTLFSDHKGLQWLMTAKDLVGQYARWQVMLSPYNFTLHYKPGVTHTVADVPSRFPRAETADTTGNREPYDPGWGPLVAQPAPVELSSPQEAFLARHQPQAVGEVNALWACMAIAAEVHQFQMQPSDLYWVPGNRSVHSLLADFPLGLSDHTPEAHVPEVRMLQNAPVVTVTLASEVALSPIPEDVPLRCEPDNQCIRVDDSPLLCDSMYDRIKVQTLFPVAAATWWDTYDAADNGSAWEGKCLSSAQLQLCSTASQQVERCRSSLQKVARATYPSLQFATCPDGSNPYGDLH